MRNTRTPFLVGGLLSAALVLLSCHGDDEATPSVNIKEFHIEKSVPLSNDSDSPTCNVSMSVKYADGADSVAANMNAAIEKLLFDTQGLGLEQAADSFANKYIGDYVDYLTQFYAADRNDTARRGWYEYRYEIDTEVDFDDWGHASYIAEKEYFEGGAHGIKQTVAVNIDMATGRGMTLGDIFVPGSDKRLSVLLLEKLKAKTGLTDIGSLRSEGYLYSMEMFASSNFTLGKDGITFIYNPYEIAPYEKGTTELYVTYDEIDELTTKQSAWKK